MHNIFAVKLLPDHFSLSNYRDTLCLEKTEEEALLNFRKAMKNALEKSRFVNINWYMHNLARGSAMAVLFSMLEGKPSRTSPGI